MAKKSFSPGLDGDDASSLLFRSPQSVEEDTVRVYARVKPLLPNEEDESPQRISYSGNEVVANPPGVSSYHQHFSFTRLFPPSVDQSTLFGEMVLPRLKDFLLGSNQLIFTYGASSSGKTYTVQGTASNPGILPRSLDLVFNSLGPSRFVEQSPLQPIGFDSVTATDSQEKILEEKNQVLSLGRLLLNEEDEGSEESSQCSGINDVSAQSLASMFPNLRHRERENTKIRGLDHEGVYYSLWISFAEIYNENIYDLFEKMPVLAKKQEKPRRRPLRLAEDRRGRIYIKGLQEVQVSTADEAYQLLLIGRKNLQFAATKLNHNSSRSHCIFTIKIMKFCDLKEPRYGRVSILSFCDLAGSERIKKMQSNEKRQKETGNINTSLLVLGRVMKALKDNQSHKDSKKLAMVPYRDSKLTRLLQVFFKGVGQASMIVNISQSPHLFDETLQALKFSAITSKINYVRESYSCTKSRRRSTFSSIMLQQKRNSNLVGRGSIVWENPVISSTMCPPNQDDEEGEGGADISSVLSSAVSEDQYEALTNLVEELKEKLNEEKQKNLTLESDIRTELCNEFNSMMVKNENEWQKRLQDTTELIEDLGEWRLAQMENAYKESRKRKRYEEKDEKGLSSTIATLESALEGKSVDLEENNKQLKVMKETHSSLLNARQKLQEELTAIKFENNRLKSQVERLKEEILTLSKENKSKELAIESLTESPIIIDLRGQLSDAKKKLSKKNEEVVYLKKLLDEAGEEFLSKDDEVQKLTSELDSLKAESAQLALELKDAQHEYSILISESNHRQEEKEQLEEQVIGFRTEITELLAEKSQLILELTNLKNEKLSSCQKLERDVILKDSKETEKELNRRISELENENKKLKFNFEESKNQFEIRIEDLQSTLQNAVDTSEALLVKNKDLKSKISLLESEVSVLGSLSSSPPQKEKPKPNLQDISVLETKEFETFERNVITEELESSKKLLDEKNNLIQEKEKIILEKEGVIASKSKELAHANKTIQEMKGKSDDQDVKSLIAKVEKKERYIHELEDIIVDKNYEITQVEDQLSQFKKKECQENVNDIKENMEKEISSLRAELDHCKSTSETLDKTLKKTLEEKDRREKDLNDEIESLRQSKIKVKSSDDLKTKQLLEKDNEIDSLEREIKQRIQADRTHEQRIEELTSEIKILENQIKKLNGDSKDIEVLGKKIGEQQNLIDSLQSQLKTKEKQENMIEILKEELELKNSEKSELMLKVTKLESYSIDASELAKLQEKVSRLEVEAHSKDEEIKQTREERENAMNNFSKLIKAKEDELVRLKQESTRIRDVIIRSSPNKNLRCELEKREATIKDLEEKVEKTIDVEVETQENPLKNEVDSLRSQITRANTKHSREIDKLKKAHNKMLQEYKDANRELQKQLGHSANLSDESFHQSMLDADESLDASLEESSSCKTKTKRKGKTRSTRKKSKAAVSPVSSNLGESLFDHPINEESTIGDENAAPVVNTTRNSSRITRSTRKSKKKSVYLSVVNDFEGNSPRKEEERRKGGTPKEEVANSEMSSENAIPEATPRRSCRKPLYNPGKLEVFSPVADSSEPATSPHTIVRRQLRTRKKK